MLGSAWDWLVGFLAVSPDGTPHHLKPDGSMAGPGPGGWMEGEWDEADETAMVECILAEEDDTYLDSLLMLPGTSATSDPSVSKYLQSGQSQPSGTCHAGKRRAGAWGEPPHVRQPESQCSPSGSTWQSLGIVAASAFRVASDVPPPPPLEDASTPTPPRNKSVRANLDSVVCQTSKEQEETGGLWPSAASVPTPRTTTAASPKSVFEGFAVKESLLPAQRPEHKGKRTLVLDLDETLVHSVFQYTPAADFTLKVQLEQGPLDVYVLKRPGVDNFLLVMAEHYEIVVFTASVREYADPLLDILDPQGVIAHRLFRESCSNSRNGYVKDLTRLGREIDDVIIVDNSPHAYAFQPDNALPILSFYDDKRDCELSKVSPFLESLGGLPGDVRQLLSAALGAKVKSLLHSRLSFLL